MIKGQIMDKFLYKFILTDGHNIDALVFIHASDINKADLIAKEKFPSLYTRSLVKISDTPMTSAEVSDYVDEHM